MVGARKGLEKENRHAMCLIAWNVLEFCEMPKSFVEINLRRLGSAMKVKCAVIRVQLSIN